MPLLMDKWRARLDACIPPKYRVIVNSSIDLVDWFTDGLLTLSLLGVLANLPSLNPQDGYFVENGTWMVHSDGDCDTSDCYPTPVSFSECVDNFDFELNFCADITNFSILSYVCLGGFLLGTGGMLATIYLRREELKLLKIAESEQQNLRIATLRITPKDLSGQPCANEQLGDAELKYRNLSKLKSLRAGKIASLLTLALEDIVMFVVNGTILHNTTSPGLLPVLVLLTSIGGTVIKIILVSELPDVIKQIKELEMEFNLQLHNAAGQQIIRHSKDVDDMDTKRREFHESLQTTQMPRSSGKHENKKIPRLFKKYEKSMANGETIANQLMEHGVQPDFAHSAEAMDSCIRALRGILLSVEAFPKGCILPMPMAETTAGLCQASLECLDVIRKLTENQAQPSLWAPPETGKWVRPMPMPQCNSFSQNEIDELPANPYLGCIDTPGTIGTKDFDFDIERVALKGALKVFGYRKSRTGSKGTPSPKSRVARRSRISSGIQLDPTGTTEGLDFKTSFDAASAIGLIFERSVKADCQRQVFSLFKSYGVPERYELYFRTAHFARSNFAVFHRLAASDLIEERKFRNGLGDLLVYISSRSRLEMVEKWGWSEIDWDFEGSLTRASAAIRVENITDYELREI